MTKNHRSAATCFLISAIALASVPLLSFAQLPVNSHPLRIGADQSSGNGFRGEMAAVRLYCRTLTTNEIKSLSSAKPDVKSTVPGVVGEWLIGGSLDGTKVSGAVKATNASDVACVRFDGSYLSVANDR